MVPQLAVTYRTDHRARGSQYTRTRCSLYTQSQMSDRIQSHFCDIRPITDTAARSRPPSSALPTLANRKAVNERLYAPNTVMKSTCTTSN